jgi:thiosulfate/3-mercaptopyruvate sulfurtransferase
MTHMTTTVTTRRMRGRAALLALGAVLGAVLGSGGGSVAADAAGARPDRQVVADMVVTTAWLADHLSDPLVVVISTDDESDYARGHVPGARQIGHMATLGDHHSLVPASQLIGTLAAAGASDDARIVLYGDSAMTTGWIYMAFAAIGHGDHVSILSGNLAVWRAEGRPVSTVVPARGGGSLTVRPAPDVVVDAAWVRSRLDDRAVSILDVRTTEERKAGYVPGSKLVLWQDLFVDPQETRFKSRDDIRRLLADAGLASSRLGVTYCAVGMRASLMYFAARYAGFPVRVYAGSWDDWRRQPGYPRVPRSQGPKVPGSWGRTWVPKVLEARRGA